MKLYLFFFVFFFSQTNFAFFYPENYGQSRDTFRATAESLLKNYPDLKLLTSSVPTRTQVELTIDSLYIPQQSKTKTKLLIITSGIHGVEAFTGSAIQIQFLKNQLTPQLLSRMGVLIVHSINPYGFEFRRRVSENNVDLNRNISGNSDLFSRHSEAYANFSSFLNPQGSLNSSFLNDIHFFVKSIMKLFWHGRKKMAQVIVGGQYQEQKGIYFGGHKLEPNATIVKEIFKNTGKPYKQILHLDLHTGYGERGKLHFFSNKAVSLQEGFNHLFRDIEVDFGNEKDFYETTGSFDFFTLNTFKRKKVIPMTLEFGTMNSQTIMGGFYSLKNMVYENQGFHQGYTNQISQEKVEKNFLDMFNPEDKKWRQNTLRTAAQAIDKLLQRFESLD